jgi:hypothetical protein
MTEHPEIPGVHIDSAPATPEELRAYAQQALQLSTIVHSASSRASLLSVAQEFLSRADLLDSAVVMITPGDAATPDAPKRGT